MAWKARSCGSLWPGRLCLVVFVAWKARPGGSLWPERLGLMVHCGLEG